MSKRATHSTTRPGKREAPIGQCEPTLRRGGNIMSTGIRKRGSSLRGIRLERAREQAHPQELPEACARRKTWRAETRLHRQREHDDHDDVVHDAARGLGGVARGSRFGTDPQPLRRSLQALCSARLPAQPWTGACWRNSETIVLSMRDHPPTAAGSRRRALPRGTRSLHDPEHADAVASHVSLAPPARPVCSLNPRRTWRSPRSAARGILDSHPGSRLRAS